jgi:hypothetical protein
MFYGRGENAIEGHDARCAEIDYNSVMPDLLEELDKRSSEIRFEVIDFSAGELVRLHSDRRLRFSRRFRECFAGVRYSKVG